MEVRDTRMFPCCPDPWGTHRSLGYLVSIDTELAETLMTGLVQKTMRSLALLTERAYGKG